MDNSGLAIFASGRGSNAENIIKLFASKALKISCIVSNKENAGVFDLAEKYEIPKILLSRDTFYNTEDLVVDLGNYGVKYISLAGFLWLVPPYLINAFPNRIINIHPALLPKFGGKGMYGTHVHTAVKEANETKTGMTIHLVNEEFDKGEILFQSSCMLDGTESPEEIAAKVLKLEHKFYPEVLYRFIDYMS